MDSTTEGNSLHKNSTQRQLSTQSLHWLCRIPKTLASDDGRAPFCAIIGCADLRTPVEQLFDTLPGEIFVLRNAGNTITHAKGGWGPFWGPFFGRLVGLVVGSLEREFGLFG